MCLLVVDSTADACPVRFLLSIYANRVHALVLLDGDPSARRVLDIVLCAGAVVLIEGFVAAL